ncbi:hypothetical protein EDB92DRAFT_1944724 [Lactarius akahatsu]|uniref:Uncharacterized protein n=1 Tax=Lactarius akahatsu TaxID=416441 RepID=A0AAD4LHL5_9AGAM|nr:hypothetical protein EDB92DRAFT_1944724 [Lactarius akahatsu]
MTQTWRAALSPQRHERQNAYDPGTLDKEQRLFTTPVTSFPDMLPQSMLCTLTGLIPTPFTRDLTHAVQFIEDLNRLVWKNLDHSLISTPRLRIDMALSFISGPTTETWKHGIRQGHLPDISIESLWDEFLDSFCETWVHCPEPTAPTVTPTTWIPTEDLSITLATEEFPPSDLDTPTPTDLDLLWPPLVPQAPPMVVVNDLPPQVLSETIDQTADEDADDWSLFALQTPVSSLVSVPTQIDPTDETPPIDEDASNTRAPRTSVISQIAPCTPYTDATPILPLATPGVPLMKESALPDQPRISRRCITIVPIGCPLNLHTLAKREREYDAVAESFPHSRKHPRTQLAQQSIPLPQKSDFIPRRPVPLIPPFDDSSGLSTPAHSFTHLMASPRLPPDSPILTNPCRAVLAAHNDSIQISNPCLKLFSGPPTSFPDLAPSPFIVPSSLFPSALPFIRTLSPVAFHEISTISDLRAPILLPNRTLDDADNAANVTLFASPPPLTAPMPSSHPHDSLHGTTDSSQTTSAARCTAPCIHFNVSATFFFTSSSFHLPLILTRPLPSASPLPPRLLVSPFLLVEDNNSSTRGVKTSSPLVLDQVIPANKLSRQNPMAAKEYEGDWTLPAPRSTPIPDAVLPLSITSHYPPIFPPRAFEQPQDPDEVIPTAHRQDATIPTHTSPPATWR